MSRSSLKNIVLGVCAFTSAAVMLIPSAFAVPNRDLVHPQAPTISGKGTMPAGLSPQQYAQSWHDLVGRSIDLKTVPAKMQPKLTELATLGKGIFSKCPITKSNESTGTNFCEFGNLKSSKMALVLGDSKAMMLVPMILNSLDLTAWHVVFMVQGSCPVADVPPLSPRKTWNLHCEQHRAKTWNYVKNKRPSLVVLSESASAYAAQSGYQAGLRRTFLAMAPKSRVVVNLVQTPILADLGTCTSRSGGLGGCIGKNIAHRGDAIQGVQQAAASGLTVKLFDLRTHLCIADDCPGVVGNLAVTYEGVHITSQVGAALAPMFASQLAAYGVKGIVYRKPSWLVF